MDKHKKRRLWLGIGAGVMVPLIVLALSINAILRHVLIVKVDRAIAEADSLYINYGSIDLDIISGKIAIHNVVFQTDTIIGDSIREFSRLEMSKVGLDGVNYYSLFVKREIDLTGITIDGVSYRGILDTKAMAARAVADAINKETLEQFQRLLKEAQKHLNRVTLKRLTINNASTEITALETGLNLIIRNIGMEVYDLGYSLIDSIPYHFNDSVMKLTIEDLNMTMPDSMMNLSVDWTYTDDKNKGLIISGIRFATDHRLKTEDPEPKTEYHEVTVGTVRLDSIDIPDMRGKKGLSVGALRVMDVHYLGIVDETKNKGKKPKKDLNSIDFAALGVKTEEGQILAMLKKKQEEAMTEQQMKMLNLAQDWLDEVKIDLLSVENSSIEVRSLKSDLSVTVDSINVSFNNLGYSLIEQIPYHFNDSIYSIAIGPIAVTTPDGFIEIDCNGFWHSNCGAISIGKTDIHHTVDKWKLAHLMGDQSATWMDITIDTFFTSKVSPFSTVYDRKLWLDTVFVRVSNMDLFVDNRNLSMPTFKMPSKETLLEIKKLWEINNIKVLMDQMRTEVTGHYGENGVITASKVALSMNDINFDYLSVGHFDALFPDGTLRLSIGGIQTVHNNGHNFIARNISFKTDERPNGYEPYHSVFVDSIIVGGMALDNMTQKNNLDASSLRIIGAHYNGWVGGEEKIVLHDDVIARKIKALQKVQQKNALEFMQEWLSYAQMQKIAIERASADIRAINSGFTLKTHDFNLTLSGIGFNIDHFIPINVEDSLVNLKYFMSNFRLLGSSAISNLGFRDLRATMPDSTMYIKVKRAHTDKSTSSVVINNVEFATDVTIPEDEMFHKVTVDTLRLDGIVLPDLRQKREATASALRIIKPKYFGLIDEGATPDSTVQNQPDPHNLEKQRKALGIIKQFFDGAALDRVSIEDGAAEFSSLVSNMKCRADGLNISLNEISYDMSSNIYNLEEVTGLKFNDTAYSVQLGHVEMLIPDSTIYLSTNNFKHENAGPISLGRTFITHAIDKWDIAHRNGDIPTTWFSMVLDTFHTSAVHPINFTGKLRHESRVALDSVIAVIDTMTIFRDMRFKAKEPYVMPHKPMLSIDSALAATFSIGAVDAKINRMNVYMPMTDTCIPYLALDSIWGSLRDLSLARGGNINIIGGGKLGSGVATVEANIGLRPEYPWNINLKAVGLDLSALNGLTYPVVGLNVGGMVHELRAEYSGDSLKANGVMMMRYNDLSAVFSKHSPSPYKFIGKNYKFFNSCARTLITHNNPTRNGRKVRAYKVSWKNDPWNPAALYMVGPIIKGAIESLLPGLFVHNKVKGAFLL